MDYTLAAAQGQVVQVAQGLWFNVIVRHGADYPLAAKGKPVVVMTDVSAPGMLADLSPVARSPLTRNRN
ncbi:hypothetical protein GCM10007421_31010 [Halopseudomonas oceani]|nr:hypothetical protein GCM10007421_31010 [Halopseudomonas oceani]